MRLRTDGIVDVRVKFTPPINLRRGLAFLDRLRIPLSRGRWR
jgi:hypothetical protein